MVHGKSVADCSHVFGTGLQQLGSFDVPSGADLQRLWKCARSKKSLDTFCKLRRSPKSLSQKRHWMDLQIFMFESLGT